MRDLMLKAIPSFNRYFISWILKITTIAILLFLPNLITAQENQFESLFLKSDSLFKLNEYEKSSILLDRAFLLDYSPKTFEYYHAARIYSLTNKIEKSIEYLEKSNVKNADIFLYDKYLDNIRGNKRYKELEHESKNGSIDFFDIINDLQSNKKVSYYEKDIFIRSTGFNLTFPNQFRMVSGGLADYSYQDLLNRAGRKDFNFEDRELFIHSSDFGSYGLFFKNINLKELAIIDCHGSINLTKCEIVNLFIGPENKVGILSISNSKIDSIYIAADSVTSFMMDSIDVSFLVIEIGARALSLVDFSIKNSRIGFKNTSIIIEVNSENTLLENNSFDGNVSFLYSEFLKRVEIFDNEFNGYLDISGTVFPEFNTYLPYRQLNEGLYIYSHDSTKNYIPSGAKLGDIKMFEKLINGYQYLFNNYQQRGEIESRYLVLQAIRDLNLDQQRYIYTRDGGINNYFTWRKAQILIWHQKNSVLSFSLLSLFIIFIGGGITWKLTRSKKVVLSEKRLAAIVFSDIVGYTQLMGNDERKAMKTINVNNAIHVTMLDRYNGRLLKEIGDGTLFSFGSASESVYFCIDVQKEIMEKDYKIRMGIHLGEVMFSKNDVFGDGVNIASRLQGKAEAGGICISDTVYQNIRNLPEIDVDFLGEGDLKNVTSKIKMYNVKY